MSGLLKVVVVGVLEVQGWPVLVFSVEGVEVTVHHVTTDPRTSAWVAGFESRHTHGSAAGILISRWQLSKVPVLVPQASDSIIHYPQSFDINSLWNTLLWQ